MIEFAWWPVFFLLPLPWLFRRFLPKAPAETQGALKVPFFDVLTSLNKEESLRYLPTPRRTEQIIAILIWVLCVISAAKPIWLSDSIQLPFSGRDLMLAVDISKSMEIEDLQLQGKPVDRLTVIKSVLNNFIPKRAGDRLGLILFGSQAYLQTPLTFDHQTVLSFLNETPIGIAGPQTAIGDAIGLAVKRLENRPNQSKVLILLTDGSNTSGTLSPIQAAEVAQSTSLKIYTIAVGASEMTIHSPLGRFFGSQTINPSHDLDESTLQNIAKMTGGLYFRAENKEELEKIYASIDQFEKIESLGKMARPHKNLFYYPLTLAFILAYILIIYKTQIFKQNLFQRSLP